MFAKIKEFFFKKPAEVSTQAPYKVEAPTPTAEVKSDGGTWPFPNVPETTATTPTLTVDGHGDVQEVKPAKKSAVKKSAVKKTADKTPAVKKSPAKKKST